MRLCRVAEPTSPSLAQSMVQLSVPAEAASRRLNQVKRFAPYTSPAGALPEPLPFRSELSMSHPSVLPGQRARVTDGG